MTGQLSKELVSPFTCPLLALGRSALFHPSAASKGSSATKQGPLLLGSTYIDYKTRALRMTLTHPNTPPGGRELGGGRWTIACPDLVGEPRRPDLSDPPVCAHGNPLPTTQPSRDQNGIIERLGSRALLIEGRVTQVDLRQEWGVEVGNAGGATV